MAIFNLMHCTLPPPAHGTAGYQEVIETVAWGLRKLGHEVRHSVNQADPDATNILFGAQILPIEQLQILPKNSIIYNFEQMRNLAIEQIRPEIHFIAQNFQIWEYSADNLEAWARLGATTNVKVVPVAYAPILTRILKPAVEDIDVLIYGGIGEKRLNAFNALSHAGLKVVFFSGFFGEIRDAFIARSKLVLNVNLYDQSRMFEIVRVSYLLANKKAVLSLTDHDTAIEDDIKPCIGFTDFDKLASTCRVLVDNADMRRAFEDYGFTVFCWRDIRAILGGLI
jgi:hypothetical protein